jgi:hypothetical protein
MSLTASISIDQICARGTVKDSDILELRRVIFGKAGIEASDIEALFRINESTQNQDPAWPALFVEAATDFLVNELPPQGYITSANAGWLMQRISKDGRIDSATELELLVSVLDKARWAPESLVRFALDQVKIAVIEGTGPLRDGARLTAGQITPEEVHLLRRILYAFGGDGSAAITRSEAEVLFDIEDATAGSPQVPEWQDLFVKAIASVVMAASGYKVPTREEALRQEQWLACRGDLSLGNFLGRMFSVYDTQTPEERALARLERQRVEIITNEEVTESEATWLAERIGRDGRTTANEQMLLAFLKRESPRIHPSLQQLVDRASMAA